ncbi:hypothetical protein [Actinokineospora sp.]|uniref:hypothetical protein n=1 Tax=Actinokineospora sp. TaxID=1872133 RepID=UPI003D6AF1B7
MPIWVAALLAVTAITVTYFSCVRPMMRGRGHSAVDAGSAQDAGMDRQIAELREELRVLRAQDSLDHGRIPGRRPMPPTES